MATSFSSRSLWSLTAAIRGLVLLPRISNHYRLTPMRKTAVVGTRHEAEVTIFFGRWAMYILLHMLRTYCI
jgi:hypothetical protein